MSEPSSYAKFYRYCTGKNSQMPGGINYLGSSLIADSKVAVRHYSSGDITGCSASIMGKNTNSLSVGDNVYYIESKIAGILDIDELETVVICRGTQNWQVMYCSPSYCYDVITATVEVYHQAQIWIK